VPSGILLVDKPLGVSSHGVVSMARKALGTKKVGHAGTLDPEASGLLVLGVGAGTRLLTYMVGLDKTYVATLRLGYGTMTDDAEGERIDFPEGDLASVSIEALDHVLARVRGQISQVPSTFSAIKVAGKRAYDLARSGAEVQLKARPVSVYRLERGEPERHKGYIDIELTIDCSSGTYIRALARDIGGALGVGGHLVALRRSAVGPFVVADALSHERIESSGLRGLAESAALVMTPVRLRPREVDDVRHGRAVAAKDWPEGVPLAAIDEASGQLVAIIQSSAGRSRILMGVPEA
jgi:tRNA pseudouridine55 synthase